MQCRQCGTEIADKAIVCYRCGTATTEPVFAPPPPARAGSKAGLITSLLALVLMVAAALFLTRSSSDDTSRIVTWVFAGVAVVIVVLRAYARRR
jgi:hypothetical protein